MIIDFPETAHPSNEVDRCDQVVNKVVAELARYLGEAIPDEAKRIAGDLSLRIAKLPKTLDKIIQEDGEVNFMYYTSLYLQSDENVKKFTKRLVYLLTGYPSETAGPLAVSCRFVKAGQEKGVVVTFSL